MLNTAIACQQEPTRPRYPPPHPTYVSTHCWQPILHPPPPHSLLTREVLQEWRNAVSILATPQDGAAVGVEALHEVGREGVMHTQPLHLQHQPEGDRGEASFQMFKLYMHHAVFISSLSVGAEFRTGPWPGLQGCARPGLWAGSLRLRLWAHPILLRRALTNNSQVQGLPF